MGALTSKIVTPKFDVKDLNPSDDRSMDEVHLDCNPKEDTLEAMGCDTSSDLDDNTTNEYQLIMSDSESDYESEEETKQNVHPRLRRNTGNKVRYRDDSEDDQSGGEKPPRVRQKRMAVKIDTNRAKLKKISYKEESSEDELEDQYINADGKKASNFTDIMAKMKTNREAVYKSASRESSENDIENEREQEGKSRNSIKKSNYTDLMAKMKTNKHMAIQRYSSKETSEEEENQEIVYEKEAKKIASSTSGIVSITNKKHSSTIFQEGNIEDTEEIQEDCQKVSNEKYLKEESDEPIEVISNEEEEQSSEFDSEDYEKEIEEKPKKRVKTAESDSDFEPDEEELKRVNKRVRKQVRYNTSDLFDSEADSEDDEEWQFWRNARRRKCSRCNSVMSVDTPRTYQISLLLDRSRRRDQDEVLCKICLMDYSPTLMVKLEDCGCSFCKECIQQYITFKVMEGAYDISCPHPDCLKQGILNQHQMERLASKDLMDKHRTFRLNTEVSIDAGRTWCPSAGCDTICHIGAGAKSAGVPVCCPTCTKEFCSLCSATWHPDITCAENGALLVKRGGADIEPMVFDSCDGNIKRCPVCNVPIERDAGCAQMECKMCMHLFCWYCLTSLDDDILLRHYDSGACKGRLGHSRAFVLWHRAQFGGFGILLLVASPLLFWWRLLCSS